MRWNTMKIAVEYYGKCNALSFLHEGEPVAVCSAMCSAICSSCGPFCCVAEYFPRQSVFLAPRRGT